tara:strand:- start:54 stop:437 length:384 start_codon:yes stop_codon:yes gene_type:complete
MKKKFTLEYPMSTLSAPVKPNDMTTFKQEQKNLTEHYVQQEWARLKQQADLIMKQAKDLEQRAELADLINKATYNFKTIVLRDYALYQNGEDYILSMILPHEWETKWVALGLVRKLADTTWEWVDSQ